MSELNAYSNRIGFMQGRLSPRVGGRIQAFPWEHWRDEFCLASDLGLGLMEWTLDEDRIRENPLMTTTGRREIRVLASDYGVQIRSLTADFVMQAPFYRAKHHERIKRIDTLRSVIDACAEIGIELIVIPLVDDGSLKDSRQIHACQSGFVELADHLVRSRIRVAFESDFGPSRLKLFLSEYPAGIFGINYDTGNSAALGFDPEEEIDAYFDRIFNVHVKDREFGGTTVPLGAGSVDFALVFSLLKRRGYAGKFILQTARAADDDHAGAIIRYRDMTTQWWEGAG